eukprot:TRINITY_DN34594_c0_g1_i1.p1 TRINITY_DN34594_c0_g1~~TRINITY_DN34594_c0_g1_i1.p1  ORF type:complete len:439 (+),score=123.99 TRINITY_DN34594_c0_g1_i1:226-1542(+)
MAAANALKVVKQIAALAEGPVSQEMIGCLSQVVSSLQFFLDHPDSRVRLNAARTLLKLARGYHAELASIDLQRAQSKLERCQEAKDATVADADTEELCGLLEQFFEAVKNPPAADAAAVAPAEAKTSPNRKGGNKDSSAGSSAPKAAASRPLPVTPEPRENDRAQPSSPPRSPTRKGSTDERGQVVLQVGDVSGALKGAVLSEVVRIDGVVSVTLEDNFLIIGTRRKEMAADACFLADVLTAMKQKGLVGAQLVSTNAGSATAAGGGFSAADNVDPAPPDSGKASNEPETTDMLLSDDDLDDHAPTYLDDGDDEEEMSGSPLPPGPEDAASPSQASAPRGFIGAQGMAGGGMIGMPGAPRFGGVAGYPMGPGAPAWSFFAQTNWMTGRRVQEYDDDPTIASRLARAKQKERERKAAQANEQKNVIGRLFGGLWGGGKE